MKRLYLLIAVMMWIVFAVNTNVFAETSVDIDKLKEQITKELQAEKPWNKDLQGWGMDIHGFISQGYMCSSDYNYLADSDGGSFGLNEIGINFSKNLTRKLRIGVQFLARDLGELYNDDIEIDWAYADYRWKDWMGMRAGILKSPHGLYNESRDIDMLRTSILLPVGVYRETSREFFMGVSGFGLYGSIPVGELGVLDYQVIAGTNNIEADDSGIGKIIEDNATLGLLYPSAGPAAVSATIGMDTMEPEEIYTGNLIWTSPWGLRLAGSVNLSSMFAESSGSVDFGGGAQTVRVEADTYSNHIYTASAEYTWEDLVFAAEYRYMHYNNKRRYYINGALTAVTDTGTVGEGYYIGSSYRVCDWFEIGAYYSIIYPDSRDKDGKDLEARGIDKHRGWQEDIALSTRFDINRYWTVKLEGHYIDGTGAVLTSDNEGISIANGYDDDWLMFLAKVSFSF